MQLVRALVLIYMGTLGDKTLTEHAKASGGGRGFIPAALTGVAISGADADRLRSPPIPQDENTSELQVMPPHDAQFWGACWSDAD
jgi:hypothetical protein